MSVVRSPLENCRGTSPTQAARCRPFLNSDPELVMHEAHRPNVVPSFRMRAAPLWADGDISYISVPVGRQLEETNNVETEAVQA